MLLYLGYLVVLIALLLGYLKYQLGYWKRRNIPHIEPIFPFGNVELRKTKHTSRIIAEIYKKFKGKALFAGFYLLSGKWVILLDQQLVKNVLIKDFNNFADRGFYFNEKHDPLTANIFFMDGVLWRRMRNKMTPVFTSGKMKYMFDTVCKVGKELALLFAEEVDAGANGKVIEVADLMSRMTTDVIGSCAFGIECNSLRNPQAEFIQVGKRFLRTKRHNRFLTTWIMSNTKLARKLGFCIILQDITDFYMRIVQETVAYREQNNVHRNDFMQILIDLKNQADNDALSISEVAAQAFFFFLAGYDTSSSTLSFILYELAQNQEIQDRLRSEIHTVLAEHNQVVSYECIKEMKYLEMVYSETLRMHPIVGHLTRNAHKRYETDDPKYFIEAGQTVVIPVLGIHHDPEFYPQPEKFIPERFTPDAIRNRPACAWLPFGEGPRNCIGMRFAKMQIAIALTYLLKDFRFSISPETQIPVQKSITSVTMGPTNGIHLKVERV